MSDSYEENAGYQPPAFQEPIKIAVLSLIDNVAIVTQDTYAVSNSVGNLDRFYDFRRSFQRVFLLMRSSIVDSDLKSELEAWICDEDGNMANRRLDLSKSGIDLVERFIEDLTNSGIIDFTGRKKRFPFEAVQKMLIPDGDVTEQ